MSTSVIVISCKGPYDSPKSVFPIGLAFNQGWRVGLSTVIILLRREMLTL